MKVMVSPAAVRCGSGDEYLRSDRLLFLGTWMSCAPGVEASDPLFRGDRTVGSGVGVRGNHLSDPHKIGWAGFHLVAEARAAVRRNR